MSEAAFALLPLVVDSHHGHVRHLTAMVCHRLVPTLLGMGGEGASKRGAGGATDRRSAAVGLIDELLEQHPSARPCRMALMRQLLLRAPDNATSRQLAVACVQSMVGCRLRTRPCTAMGPGTRAQRKRVAWCLLLECGP